MCEVFKKTNLDPGGFAEYVRLSEDHLKHTAFKVPSQMPWQEAVFTEPLACCVRNVDRLSILEGDTIIIIGLGSIGLMMAKLLKRLKCQVIGIDLDEKRCEESLKYGVNFAFPSTNNTEFKIQNSKLTEDRGADGIIFTAGPAKMLNPALKWLRNGGFVNLFSHLSGEVSEIDTSELYHRELQIITTYSASPDSLKKAFEILRDENLNLREMFAPTYDPSGLQQAVDDINSRKVLKALITFF